MQRAVRLWTYTVRGCAWSPQHAALDVALQPRAYETLQEYCYGAGSELPAVLNVVLSTPSASQALHVHLYEEVYLVIAPPGARRLTSQALRSSASFSSLQRVAVRVTGITPLRDRVGRFTHRAVCRVQL